MRKETYKGWTRVSKAKAEKIFNAGQPILIAPVNANMRFLWQIFEMRRTPEGEEGWDNFAQMNNEFTYYNCNKELGSYPKYFVKEV